MINNTFETKDATRIADILRKSATSNRSASSFAEQMAKSITSADKARRRANAALAVGRQDLALIFDRRSRELGGEPMVITAPVAPMPTIEVGGVEFRQKEKFSDKPRIYFWKDERDTKDVLDMVGQRYTPKSLFTPLLKEVLAPIGRADVKVSWSQYAGCSCPCSPGFVLQDSSYAYDIHVTYRIVKVKATKKAS